MKDQGTGTIHYFYVHYNKVSLYQSSFSHLFLNEKSLLYREP